MSAKRYEEHEITEFLEHAQEVGVSRALRDMGYPGSYATAYKWADQRGIDMSKSAQMRAAIMSRYMMDDAEQIEVAQTGIERVREELTENPNLDPIEYEKLSQALKRFVELKQLLEGKVTSRHEQINKDAVQAEIDELMNQFENA